MRQKIISIFILSLLVLGFITVIPFAYAEMDIGNCAAGPGATQCTVNWAGNGIVKDDVLIVLATALSGSGSVMTVSSITDNTAGGSDTFTLIANSTDTNCAAGFALPGYYCGVWAYYTIIGTATPTTVTEHTSGVTGYVEMYVIDTGFAYDTTTIQSSGGKSDSGAAGSVTSYTPVANSVIMTAFSIDAGGGCSAGTGYILATSAQNWGGMEWKNPAAGTATTSPITCAGSKGWAGLSVAIARSSTTTTSTITSTSTITTTATVTSTVSTTVTTTVTATVTSTITTTVITTTTATSTSTVTTVTTSTITHTVYWQDYTWLIIFLLGALVIGMFALTRFKGQTSRL